MKFKTNMKCSCGSKMNPTDDFFVWECSKCAWSWVLQMSPQFIPEKNAGIKQEGVQE